jgi:hypothetical protein
VSSGKSATGTYTRVQRRVMGHNLRWMVAGSLKNICEPEMRVVWTGRETIMGGIMSTVVPLVLDGFL